MENHLEAIKHRAIEVVKKKLNSSNVKEKLPSMTH